MFSLRVNGSSRQCQNSLQVEKTNDCTANLSLIKKFKIYERL